MVEFLSDFVVHCISKDLNSCVYSNVGHISSVQNEIHTVDQMSAEPASPGADDSAAIPSTPVQNFKGH